MSKFYQILITRYLWPTLKIGVWSDDKLVHI